MSVALKCKNRKQMMAEYCRSQMESFKYNWNDDYFWFEVAISQPHIKSEEELKEIETFPEDRIWFNVLFYQTSDCLKYKRPSIYNHIKDELNLYYDENDNCRRPDSLRVRERIEPLVKEAKKKIFIAEEIQMDYYKLNNRYLGCIQTSARYKKAAYYKDTSARRYATKNEWMVDFYWMEQSKKRQDTHKTPDEKDMFPEERLYFNCLFYETIWRLKTHNKIVYLYLKDSKLLKNYYDNSGRALYPKYNEALKKLLIQTIDFVKILTKYKEDKRHLEKDDTYLNSEEIDNEEIIDEQSQKTKTIKFTINPLF